jgi:hypothetical protein
MHSKSAPQLLISLGMTYLINHSIVKFLLENTSEPGPHKGKIQSKDKFFVVFKFLVHRSPERSQHVKVEFTMLDIFDSPWNGETKRPETSEHLNTCFGLLETVSGERFTVRSPFHIKVLVNMC